MKKIPESWKGNLESSFSSGSAHRAVYHRWPRLYLVLAAKLGKSLPGLTDFEVMKES